MDSLTECDVSPEILAATNELTIENEELLEFMNEFNKALENSLKKTTRKKSSLKCFLTYVQNLPSGNEKGRYIGIELTEATFQVMLYDLGTEECDSKQKIFRTPTMGFSSGHEFFDILARYLAESLIEFGVAMECLSIGFICAFPVDQKGIDKGILSSWAKNMNVKGVVGKDIVQLFRQAIYKRKDIKARIVAILNDTTATLIGCAYENKYCKIGIIIDSGTNACYVEKQCNAELFDDINYGSGEVLINTEWGSFGDLDEIEFIRLSYDVELDNKSMTPGFHRFEKMISTLYIGELCRLAMMKYIRMGIFLHKGCLELLAQKGAFNTIHLIEIEKEQRNSLQACRQVFLSIGVPSICDKDCLSAKLICSNVTKRAAHLIAGATACLVNKINVPKIAIGFSGFLYTSHQKIPGHIYSKLKELIDPAIKVQFYTATEANCKGAAVVASTTIYNPEAESKGFTCFPFKK